MVNHLVDCSATEARIQFQTCRVPSFGFADDNFFVDLYLVNGLRWRTILQRVVQERSLTAASVTAQWPCIDRGSATRRRHGSHSSLARWTNFVICTSRPDRLARQDAHLRLSSADVVGRHSFRSTLTSSLGVHRARSARLSNQLSGRQIPGVILNVLLDLPQLGEDLLTLLRRAHVLLEVSRKRQQILLAVRKVAGVQLLLALRTGSVKHFLLIDVSLALWALSTGCSNTCLSHYYFR